MEKINIPAFNRYLFIIECERYADMIYSLDSDQICKTVFYNCFIGRGKIQQRLDLS